MTSLSKLTKPMKSLKILKNKNINNHHLVTTISAIICSLNIKNTTTRLLKQAYIQIHNTKRKLYIPLFLLHNQQKNSAKVVKILNFLKMSSFERTKKRVQIYNKAIFHFLFCFVMGFLIGFAPMGKSSIFPTRVIPSAFSPNSLEIFQEERIKKFNRSLLDENVKVVEKEEDKEELVPKRLIIVATPTSTEDELKVLNLRRLGNTLRLVASPLLWIVIEKESDSNEVSKTLRETGVMYRHLVFKENFTDVDAEMDYQRNFVLSHIEHHRINGIVHFSELSNVYDLSFFDEIRAIEVFGAWPMAYLSANRKRVKIEGPVCESSQVVGWKNNIDNDTILSSSTLHISSFAFNSSILWDPERWGRSSSVQETSQNTINFIKKEILEEETNVVGIPADGCSKIMTWNWNLHLQTTLPTTIK